MSKVVFRTKKGVSYQADTLNLLNRKIFREKYLGKIDLILTSPPFSLARKKSYGNENGEEYIDWLTSFAKPLSEFLSEKGSIAIELGNSFEKGDPIFSTIPIEALISFKKEANLYLCQEFICHNPARLPSPAQWVTVNRFRLKDSYTRIWWLSKTPYPKSDNSQVLRKYSSRMKQHLKTNTVNTGTRPSGHTITESFLKNNKGSISPNVLELGQGKYLHEIEESLFPIANANNHLKYNNFCRDNDLEPHPARMQDDLVDFLIRFLTDENDLVFDPFGGSNTTGYVAEGLNRNWISSELNIEYIKGSLVKFHHEIEARLKIEKMARNGI